MDSNVARACLCARVAAHRSTRMHALYDLLARDDRTAANDLTRVSIGYEISSLLAESSAIFKRSGLPTITYTCLRLVAHLVATARTRLKKMQQRQR